MATYLFIEIKEESPYKPDFVRYLEGLPSQGHKKMIKT
jgi:hypothetical protein